MWSAAAFVLAGCAVAPRVIPVSVSPGQARPSAERIADYPEALAAIASVMVEELKLPVLRASLILYPHRDAFETGLVTERRFDPFLARDTARFSWGVGEPDNVLVNEAALLNVAWPDRIRFLAHEFTHTVQYAFANGRRSTSDQWLREGFADWVSYRVLESLGLATFAEKRESRLAQIRGARDRQPFPSLTQMVTFREWVTLRNRHGATVTYGQAFLAVDFLIERKGLPAVVEYFRLFGQSEDRLVNFQTAFGRELSAFESEFATSLQSLLR
jgi:hypothetical protein